MLRFPAIFLLLAHGLVVSSDAAQTTVVETVSVGGNLRLGDSNHPNIMRNIFEEHHHRRMADQQCMIEGIGACAYEDNGEYYKDCGESDYWGAGIIFKTKSDMWCFSEELDQDICCGDAMDCCDVQWWIAASILVGISILFSIFCCGLCYFCNRCCFSKRAKKKSTTAPASTDDEDGNSN